ncbi:MAG TPA: hypothetical protein VGY48_12480 [Vicinamibacterales bacterium]|jgi:hypothetical protein|nr:hypothetical protein [Vicinamibacterales bacterium]
MADIPDASQDVNWTSIVLSVMAELAKNENLSFDGVRGAVVAGVTQSHGAKLKAGMTWLTWIATEVGKALAAVEDVALPPLAGFTAPIVGNMFGTEVDASAFSSRSNTGARNAATSAMVEAFLSAITEGAAEPAEPTDVGAKRLAAAGLHASLEGWFMAAVPELLSDLLPFEVGHFDVFARLPEEVIQTLGIGRLVRRALQPLVNATATTPMTWAANKKYRPTKLGITTVTREYLRGNRSYDDLYESLTRDGYRDEDIEGLVNEQKKFATVADLELLVRALQLDQATAVQRLRDQGYDEDLANTLIGLERLKRIEAFELAMADAAITAYSENRIDGSTLDAYTHGSTMDQQRGAQLRELADAKRALRAKNLTPAEAEACVVAGVLPFSEYRAALDRDGYVPDAGDALELLLRAKIDKKATAEQLKAQQAAERAAAAQAKADAAAAKKAQIDAARAVKQLGSIAELEHAVVRGLIPISRLEEVLTADFDTDTVAIYVADVEQKRAAYVAQQQKAADAAKRAAAKGLSTAALEQAALDHVLTVGQVHDQLLARGIAAADVDILTATLQVKVTDHDAAVKLHADAVAKAAVKHISLGRFEQLVLKGHRTLQDYDQLLASLGYDDASRAAMGELLGLKIAAAGKAAQLRTSLAAANPAKGLTLAQFRRAVIIGDKTIDQFQTFLVNEGYTADAQATLTDELRNDVDAADAARQRRAQAASTTDARALPLADVTRAARLGLLTPAAYSAELTARGYTADDIALELDLLSTEIAQTQAARDAKAAAAAATAPKGLTLAEIAKAVKAGDAPIGEYQARALALGYSAADTAQLVKVLQDEVDTLAIATRRHVQIDGELAARSLSLAEVEKAVTDGMQTLDQYETWLKNNGYGAADAGLLRALLEAKLPPPAPPTSGP